MLRTVCISKAELLSIKTLAPSRFGNPAPLQRSAKWPTYKQLAQRGATSKGCTCRIRESLRLTYLNGSFDAFYGSLRAFEGSLSVVSSSRGASTRTVVATTSSKSLSLSATEPLAWTPTSRRARSKHSKVSTAMIRKLLKSYTCVLDHTQTRFPIKLGWPLKYLSSTDRVLPPVCHLNDGFDVQESREAPLGRARLVPLPAHFPTSPSQTEGGRRRSYPPKLKVVAGVNLSNYGICIRPRCSR